MTPENFFRTSYTLSRLPRTQSGAVNFFEHGAAALADRGIILVLADVRRIVPAALAFLTLRFFDLDMHAARPVARALRQADRRHDEQVAQLGLVTFQKRVQRIGS